MKGDCKKVSILLTKNPSGRARLPKPMRIGRGDAEHIVGAGRANFISKSNFRKLTAEAVQRAKVNQKNRPRK